MKEELLILVKTYPVASKKYRELVCTAGINRQGKWRRIHPIRFRSLDELEKYKKYQWIEVDLEKNTADRRPESYRLRGEINVLGDPVPTKNYWAVRKEVLESTRVYKNLDEIIEKARVKNELSLCRFKPDKILGLKIKKVAREWPKSTLQAINQADRQKSLFEELNRQTKLVRKLPYKFSYHFADVEGRKPKMMIADWEIGQLYWNCFDKSNDEEYACQKVKEKYEGFITENDVTLFLGTTLRFHGIGDNPFIIVGVFYPPKTKQPELMS